MTNTSCTTRIVLAFLTLAALLAAVPLASHAQSGVLAYPGAGQSADQQARDEYECQQWARNQTGFDPNRPPPQVYADSTVTSSGGSGFGSGQVGQGGMLRDGARGAALGAMGGAIAGDAGGGAAAGAAAGALFGAIRRSSRQQQEQQWQAQQQAQVQQQQQMANQQYAQAQQGYLQAVRLCLSSRNYNVH